MNAGRRSGRRLGLVAASLLVTTSLTVTLGTPAPVAAYETPGTIELFGSGQISSPNGIVAAPDGDLYFTNPPTNRIGRITTSGAVFLLAASAHIDDPRDITVGPDGNLWFTNRSGHSIGRITKTLDGQVPNWSVTSFTAPGVSAPESIVAGPDGNLWFTNSHFNSTQGSIGRITPAGVISTYTAPSVQGPNGITLGADGNLWFANQGLHPDYAGSSIGRITTSGVISHFTGFGIDRPFGITRGPDDRLWFTNLGNDSIGALASFGEFSFTSNYTAAGVASPARIIAGADGKLWFTNGGGAPSVASVTTAGTFAFHDTGGGGFSPYGITRGPEGNVWITNPVGNQVGRVATGEAYGFLRATTSPALPATITVDGSVRDAWGLNWVPTEPGSHEVCFGPVDGFAAPPCQTVQVALGQTTTITGSYTPRGYLRVTTSPAIPSTITVDGVPRNDWGLWTDVAPGDYEVCFGPAAGWAPPHSITTTRGSNTAPEGCVIAQVVSGDTTVVTGSFLADPAAPGPVEPHGLLRVATDPAVPSPISIDGQWRDTWGLTWVKLPPGQYQVCLGPVLGFTVPGCTNAAVVAGETTQLTLTPQAQGYLRVVTDPSVPATILNTLGQPLNTWGVWVPRTPESLQVCFGWLPGMVTPPCQNATIVAGQTTTVTATYTPN